MRQLWEKIWNDPVWSKVIAAGFIFVLSQLLIFIWGLISSLNFIGVYQLIFKFLANDYLIKGWIILLVGIFLIGMTCIFFFNFKPIKKKENSTKESLDNSTDIENKEELSIHEAPTVFFHNRFCDTFPGIVEGYKWVSSKKEIHNRLSILLGLPTKFTKLGGYGVVIDRIWWFRGTGALYIQNFEILSSKKVLINWDELNIEKIAAFKGNSYFEDFVYVQCNPDKPTGLYKHNKSILESYFKENREYHEEFGIYKNKLISRQEYDDGSTVIRGKPIRMYGAKLRTRTLIKYNFIIAAKYSPYNCQEFCRTSMEYFGKLLKNEIDFDDFVVFIRNFPKHKHDD